MKNKKMIFLISLVLVLFFCAFTLDSQENPEETDYVMSVLFDLGDDGIRTVYEAPVLKKDEAQAVLYGEQKVSQFTIEHFKDFADEYMNNVLRKPDFQHLKVLLIGENLLNDSEMFAEFIAFLHEQNEFSENVFVAIDKSGGKVLQDENESAGNCLENLFSKRNNTNMQMSTTIGKLLASSYNENQALYIPTVSEDKKIEGEWVVACKKAVSYMSLDTAKWFLTANCIDCGCELYFQDVYGETLDDKDNFSIEVSRVKREFSFSENEDRVNADILLTLKGRVKNYCGDVITDAADRLNKEQLFSIWLSEKYQNLAAFSEGKDLFNTYYEVSNKKRTIWKKYHNSYEKYVKNLDVNIVVDVEFTE